MGSGSKKNKGAIEMGNYSCKVSEQEAMLWCMRNGIYISPFAKSTTEWFIVISINGKSNQSPIAYEKNEIWKQMYVYFLYYYNKHHNIIIKEEVKVVKKNTRKEKVIESNPKLF
jgi:hypothetical protein